MNDNNEVLNEQVNEMRELSLEEVLAVAGGPQVTNDAVSYGEETP